MLTFVAQAGCVDDPSWTRQVGHATVGCVAYVSQYHEYCEEDRATANCPVRKPVYLSISVLQRAPCLTTIQRVRSPAALPAAAAVPAPAAGQVLAVRHRTLTESALRYSHVALLLLLATRRNPAHLLVVMVL